MSDDFRGAGGQFIGIVGRCECEFGYVGKCGNMDQELYEI